MARALHLRLLALTTRRFAPSPALTALLAVACAACVLLGRWQWHRGEYRQAQWDAFARGAGTLVDAPPGSLGQEARFQRLRVTGRYDPQHQFLLDNQSHDGRAGFEILTPLERADGPVLLVDRGWVPLLGSRRQLPDVRFEAGSGERTLTGRIDNLPAAGLALGRAAPPTQGEWPRLTTFPTPDELAASLGRPVEPRILRLDPGLPDGYVRDWHPPGIAPLRNWSYALQWWSFAVLGLVFWVIVGFQRGRKA